MYEILFIQGLGFRQRGLHHLYHILRTEQVSSPTAWTGQQPRARDAIMYRTHVVLRVEWNFNYEQLLYMLATSDAHL